MKMMLKQKLKQLKSTFQLQKAAGRVLEGDIADQVKELVDLLKNEAKVI